MSDQQTLGQFGKTFQERFVEALLTDQQFGQQMLEVFQVEYVDLKYLQFLARHFFDYAKRYKVFPSRAMLLTIVKDELKAGLGTDAVLQAQIIDYLKRLQAGSVESENDMPFVKDKSLEFCRKQALRKALEGAVEKLASGRYETIAEEVKKATMVGTAPAMGHDFMNDIDARFERIARRIVPSSISQLNHKTILDGGYGAGELHVVMAPSGVGKCAHRDTYIDIKYVAIRINGQLYKPWERVTTKRGTLYARDVLVTDELI